MTDKTFKIIQWLLYAMMAVSAIFGIMFYVNPSNPNLLIYWGYVLILFSALATIGAALINIIKNPKGSMKLLMILVGMVVIGFISYSLSTNTYSSTQLEKYQISASGVRLVGAGLFITYFMAIVAIGSFIYTSVSRFFK